MTGETQLVRRVFISFAGKGAGQCAEDALAYASNVLKPSLERAGLEVMMVEIGFGWTQVVEEAAAHNAVLMPIITKAYLKRYFCMRELDLAMHGLSSRIRDRNPVVIPILYHTHLPCDGDQLWQKFEARKLHGAQYQMDLDRWQQNVKRMAGLPLVQLHTSADQAAATKRAVELAVAAVHKDRVTAYDWQQVARLAAQAAVPAEGRTGVALLGAGGCIVEWPCDRADHMIIFHHCNLQLVDQFMNVTGALLGVASVSRPLLIKGPLHSHKEVLFIAARGYQGQKQTTLT